jgi:hypothetical protein
MENIFLLSMDDLKDAFREVIQEMNPNPDDELLTSQGLAEYLGYSIDWVMRASSRVKGLGSFLRVSYGWGNEPAVHSD